eukprot:GILJ01008021.1.p1 GENE.GILJ01008021.1~~GILJ01008021.1.p1  ORF type:complete len:338 (+),score=37.40 GILJ01008021.1:88-1014(+)
MMSYGDPEWRSWVLNDQASRPFIERAWEHGINFFDTADVYSKGESERVLGRAVSDLGIRDKVVIASKCYFATGTGVNDKGLSRKHILSAVENSLQRLGTDYIDLYQIHRFDPNVPVEEFMCTLNDLVRSGKVRYIGASSMYAWQFSKCQYIAEKNGWAKFISMQNHYNLVYREEEREMVPLCLDQGVGMIPWSPLARGFLAGNRTRDHQPVTARVTSDPFADDMYYAEEDFAVVDAVKAVAATKNVAPAQVALAWLLHKPSVTAPIIGATKMSHLDDAVAALKVSLTAEDIAALEAPYKVHRVLGNLS